MNKLSYSETIELRRIVMKEIDHKTKTIDRLGHSLITAELIELEKKEIQKLKVLYLKVFEIAQEVMDDEHH